MKNTTNNRFMPRTTPLVAAALSATLALPVVAQPGQRGERGQQMIDKIMSRMDTNGDNAISRTEIETQRAQTFDKLDADGDGLFTRAEADALAERAQRQRDRRRAERDPFANFDANGDGALSRSEFVNGEPRMLARADTDGDGRVTRAELEQAAAKARGNRGR